MRNFERWTQCTVLISKADTIHQSNADRARVETDLQTAKARLSDALEDEAKECASGDGTKCKGWRATRQERESYVNVLEAQLRLMKPEATENPELHQAAKVFASMPGLTASEEAIFAALVLWFPFVKALFCEVATLVFGGIGFSHPSRTVPGLQLSASPRPATVPPTVPRRGTVPRVANLIPFSMTATVPAARCGVPATKAQALQLLRTEIEQYAIVPSQDALKQLFGVRSKSTVSRWLSDWEAEGFISRTQSGRRKEVRVS